MRQTDEHFRTVRMSTIQNIQVYETWMQHYSKTHYYLWMAACVLNQTCGAIFQSGRHSLFSSKWTMWREKRRGEREEAKSRKVERWKGRRGGEGCTLKTLSRENYTGREQGLCRSAQGAWWKNKGKAWSVGKPSVDKTLDKCRRQDRKSQTP